AFALCLALVPTWTLQAGADPEDEEVTAPQPETVSQAQLEQQLRRTSGQTSYITAQRSWRGNFGARALSAAAAPEAAVTAPKGGTEKRDVLESDVFAIDPETKVLYLLNGQRGLQAVSAQNELLGRAAASGNHPENMYFVKSKGKKRLVVLEHDYQRRYEDQ